jgi:hypothetical protein
LRERSPLPAEVEARVRLLERFEDAEAADGRA